jgi:hypothetical protein
MGQAGEELSTGICIESGLLAWFNWCVLCLVVSVSIVAAVALSGSVHPQHIVSQSHSYDVWIAFMFTILLVAIVPPSDHVINGWSSFETWPALGTVCLWLAYGVMASSAWGSEAVAMDPDGDGENEGNGGASSGSTSIGYAPLFGMLALCCAMFTHSRFVYESWLRTRLVTVLYALLVAMSAGSRDAIVVGMPQWVAVLKIVTFFALYVACSLSLVSGGSSQRGRPNNDEDSGADSDPSGKNKTLMRRGGTGILFASLSHDAYMSRERLLVQSSWPLFTWRYLMVLAVVQLVFTVFHILATLLRSMNGLRGGGGLLRVNSTITTVASVATRESCDGDDHVTIETNACRRRPALPSNGNSCYHDQHHLQEVVRFVNACAVPQPPPPLVPSPQGSHGTVPSGGSRASVFPCDENGGFVPVNALPLESPCAFVQSTSQTSGANRRRAHEPARIVPSPRRRECGALALPTVNTTNGIATGSDGDCSAGHRDEHKRAPGSRG